MTRNLAVVVAIPLAILFACDDDDGEPIGVAAGGTPATGGVGARGGTGGTTGAGGAPSGGGTAGTGGGLGPDSSTSCAEPTWDKILQSVPADTPPTLDGSARDWGCLPAWQMKLDANVVYTPEGSATTPAYPGLTTTTVTLKSVYTKTHIYFLATWQDPTKSLARFPWVKQADGSWKQLKNPDTSGHENTWYEDKLGLQWNINVTGFATAGCFSNCHLISDPAKPSYPGKKFNENPGEVADLWHWKSVRTGPNGQLDDGSVVYRAPTAADLNGRVNDPSTSGGYKDNTFAAYKEQCLGDPQGALNVPCFMGPGGQELVGEADKFWIFESEKRGFEDTFPQNATIAGIVVSKIAGSRGDVSTVANWENGTWTVEIERTLTTPTGSADDVQFDDLGKSYFFGVAVFDNSQINHALHGGVGELRFRDF